ncbi:MAG: L,D-transpeptidase family protein [Prolixibacteraceae bacterium]|nr:L,D-transpeptidase family protein [Prolixibacteraceae bacterium]
MKLISITLIIFAFFLIATGCVKKPVKMHVQTEDQMVQDFYTLNHQFVYWFSTKKSRKKAHAWLLELKASELYGIASNDSLLKQITSSLENHKELSSVLRDEADQQLTGLVLNFIKELQEGKVHFDYDEIWYSNDSVYVNQLLKSKPGESAQKMTARFDCKDPGYQLLKEFLNDSITPLDTLQYYSVVRAMNYQRYIARYASPEYIVVNIPEMNAQYYNKGDLSLQMRTVVGRKQSPTPTIASYISSIVTFPFWNVPHSIAVREILPKVQNDEIYLENNNLAVVDADGNEVFELEWMDYTERNFPYFFRQSTGSNNALGVLKFNFENPYSVYLHSTNSLSGFLRDQRSLSHGCIRLEKPIDLATSLLRGKLDIEALKSGKKDTESVKIELQQKVPVFIIYSLVSFEGNKIAFLPDVYGLIQQP